MIKILEIRFEEKSRKKEIRNISGKQKYHIIFKMYDKIVCHKIFEKVLSKVLNLENPKKIRNTIHK